MTHASALFLDGLTGSHNRAYFMDRLSEAADAARGAYVQTARWPMGREAPE